MIKPLNILIGYWKKEGSSLIIKRALWIVKFLLTLCKI